MKVYLSSASQNAKDVALKALFLTKSFLIQNQKVIFISAAVSAIVLMIGLFIENHLPQIKAFFNRISDAVKSTATNSVNKINEIVHPKKLEVNQVIPVIKKSPSTEDLKIITDKLDTIQESINKIKPQRSPVIGQSASEININQNSYASSPDQEDEKDFLDAMRSLPRPRYDPNSLTENYFQKTEDKKRADKKDEKDIQK